MAVREGAGVAVPGGTTGVRGNAAGPLAGDRIGQRSRTCPQPACPNWPCSRRQSPTLGGERTTRYPPSSSLPSDPGARCPLSQFCNSSSTAVPSGRVPKDRGRIVRWSAPDSRACFGRRLRHSPRGRDESNVANIVLRRLWRRPSAASRTNGPNPGPPRNDARPLGTGAEVRSQRRFPQSGRS